MKYYFKYLIFALLFGVLNSVCAQDKQELMVFAAGSLSSAFKEIGQKFEGQNPNVHVVLNFAAAGVLIQQMAQGAPVDVFASADQAMMDRASIYGLIDDVSRRDFAQNMLVVALPITSEFNFQCLEDLSDDHFQNIGLGRPGITPAGNYIQEVLQQAKLWEVLEGRFIFAEHVTQVIRYISTAEVDVGFVFRSDALRHADDLRIAFVVSTGEDFVYPIARARSSEQAELAQKFIDFVLSDEGQKVLMAYGFDVKE